MIDEREIVRRAVEGVTPPGPPFDRLLRRRDRHQRNQRITAGIVGVAVALAVLVGGVSLLRSSSQPATTVDGALPPILRDGEVLIQNFHGGQLEAVDPSTGDRRTILDCEAVSIPAEDSCGRIGDPAISADGRWLAYSIHCGTLSCPPETGIWVTNARGDKHQLMEGGQSPLWAWSPQGSTLAASAYGEASGLVTIDPQTGDRTTVASPGGYISALAWSPDGTEIIYAGTGLVESVNLESGEITELADVGRGAIAWSPDGSQIAFDDYDGGRERIIVMNRDGSDQHVLVDKAAPDEPGSPTWSPDGTEIAYVTTLGGQRHFLLEVWVIGVDGSNDTRVYHSPCCAGGGEYPVWSPDGSRIAISPQIDGYSSRWIVVNADGTGSPEPIDRIEVLSW